MELPPLSSKDIKNITSLLSSLKGEDGKNLVTKKQCEDLASLRFSDGEMKLSMEYRNFVYEVVWMLNELGFDITYNFLSADWEKVFGSQNIRKKMLFENPLLEDVRKKFETDMNIYKDKIEVEAGEKCRKCQSTSTISLSKQIARADEQVALQIVCLDCRYKWRAQ